MPKKWKVLKKKKKKILYNISNWKPIFSLAFSSEIAKQVTPIFLLFSFSFNIVATLVNSTQTRFVIIIIMTVSNIQGWPRYLARLVVIDYGDSFTSLDKLVLLNPI